MYTVFASDVYSFIWCLGIIIHFRQLVVMLRKLSVKWQDEAIDSCKLYDIIILSVL